MYIVEILLKWLEKRKYRNFEPQIPELDEEDLRCEHLFLPIDSASLHLACSKCGLVIKNKT